MTADPRPDARTLPRRRARAWACLVLALLWAAALRAPIVLNASDHLDSDLAVDGLTLLDALDGRWRWHYPGTPFIGSAGVLLSYPQAWILGAGPETLASGGTVAALLVVAGSFWLALRAFGPSAACWALVPSAFASAGTLWLSARITGGHLLAAAWHAAALGLWHACLTRDRARDAAILGLFCGLGIWVDRMFAIGAAAIAAVSAGAWLTGPRGRAGLGRGLAFALALAAGLAPQIVGKIADPHDAYVGQFAPTFEPAALSAHARLLAEVCLPRLIGGHAAPRFGPEPAPAGLPGRVATAVPSATVAFDPWAALATGLALALFLAAILALAAAMFARDRPGRLVAQALLLAAGLNVGAFLANRTVDQSDHYRYLVMLLVPWSAGFGVLADALARRGRGGKVLAAAASVALAAALTVDVYRWYRAYGWIDPTGLPSRAAPPDPALDWFREHPEAGRIYGDYWDVYRLAFLTEGRLVPVPIPIYPDRFPANRLEARGEGPWYLVSRRGAVPAGWAVEGGGPGGRVLRWSAPGGRDPWEAP